MQQHPCIQTFEKAYFESVRNMNPYTVESKAGENCCERTDYVTA